MDNLGLIGRKIAIHVNIYGIVKSISENNITVTTRIYYGKTGSYGEIDYQINMNDLIYFNRILIRELKINSIL